MSVANVGSSAFSGFQTGSSYSVSKVTGSSSQVLRVHVFIFAAATVSASVTYNSVSLSQIKYISNSAGANNLQMYVFQMVNPPTGTFNIAVTLGSAVASYTEAHSYSGADQNTPQDSITTWESNYGNTPSTTVSITPNYNGKALAAYMSDEGVTRFATSPWSNYSAVSSGGNKNLTIGEKNTTAGTITTATFDNDLPSFAGNWLVLSSIVIEPIVFQPAWARNSNYLIQGISG